MYILKCHMNMYNIRICVFTLLLQIVKEEHYTLWVFAEDGRSRSVGSKLYWPLLNLRRKIHFYILSTYTSVCTVHACVHKHTHARTRTRAHTVYTFTQHLMMSQSTALGASVLMALECV